MLFWRGLLTRVSGIFFVCERQALRRARQVEVVTLRSFGLQDIPLIWKLQSEESRLDLPEMLFSPRSSLHHAILGYLFRGEAGADTFVSDRHEGQGAPLSGFAQVRPRRGRAEWDILALAPSLELAPTARQTWVLLLQGIAAAAGEQGILRVFAKAVKGSAAEDLLRAADWRAYAHEDIFCCDSSARFAHLTRPEVILSPIRPEDDWGLHHLYIQITPSSVQLAEGYPASESGHALSAWLPRLGAGVAAQEYVLREEAEIYGYVCLFIGSKGYGLRVAVHPDHAGCAGSLLLWGLGGLATRPARPVYCVMRQYEGSSSLLHDYGFDLFTTQALLVRQFAVRVKEALFRTSPALEQRVERVATHTFEEKTN
jgi:hypothetical protein